MCESRWPSWAPRPNNNNNEPYGFCGRKATSNHAYALVTSEDIKLYIHSPPFFFPQIRAKLEREVEEARGLAETARKEVTSLHESHQESVRTVATLQQQLEDVKVCGVAS